jgi:hypothetical protein
MLDPLLVVEPEGNATRAEQTPLEPLPALGRRPELRRPNESHTAHGGQPM